MKNGIINVLKLCNIQSVRNLNSTHIFSHIYIYICPCMNMCIKSVCVLTFSLKCDQPNEYVATSSYIHTYIHTNIVWLINDTNIHTSKSLFICKHIQAFISGLNQTLNNIIMVDTFYEIHTYYILRKIYYQLIIFLF